MACATTCGLILLGNSGVGKSFLANRLLDDDKAFESRFSARSVTRHTEWKNMSTAIGKHIYSVANIPGLVEANQRLIDENRIEIMKAFEQCPFAVVLFVFGHKNGRIPDEDLVAFMRINDAYQFPSESLLLIINGIPSDRPNVYEEKTTELLQELTHVDRSHIYFIEKTTSQQSKRDIHDLLHEAVAKCEPTYHEKKHDIELLADEISRLKMESKQRQEQLLAQENDYSNKQKLNLTADSPLELHRPSSQQSFNPVMNSKPDIIDQNKQFEEMMKDMQAEHEQNMDKLTTIQHNSNTDAVKQLTQELETENKRQKELLDQMSTSPPVSAICEERRGNKLRVIKKAAGKFVTFVADVFLGEPQSRESMPHEASRYDPNERNFQSSAPHAPGSDHRNPTNK